MIEREFIKEKMKEFLIKEFIDKRVSGAGHSHTVIKRTPLGDKIIIYASKPGLIVGRKGANIRELTESLKKQFDLENPQVEINEVENLFLDANIVAERIASSLERFGSMRFKRIAYSTIKNVINAGALGVEIKISGKIPSSRARTWRFYQGLLKKSGSVSQRDILYAKKNALLKTGIVGVQVKLMPPDVTLPDTIVIREVPELRKQYLEEVRKAQRSSTYGDEDIAYEEEQDLPVEDVSEIEEIEKKQESKTKKPVKKKPTKPNEKATEKKPKKQTKKTESEKQEPVKGTEKKSDKKTQNSDQPAEVRAEEKDKA